MLIEMKIPEVNAKYNSSFEFHNLQAKSNLVLHTTLEETLNDLNNKIIIAKSLCGAIYLDGKLNLLDLSYLKTSKTNYYSNLVSVYENLIKIDTTYVTSYGDMLITYSNKKFYVSGESPIENLRNIVYNAISASIIYDYKLS